MKKPTTFDIALSGVMTAIITLFLFFSAVSPTGNIGFYALSGVCLMLLLSGHHVISAILTAIASTLLAMIFVPNGPIQVIPFAGFVAPFALLQYAFLMRPDKRTLGNILKWLYFNVFLIAILCFADLFIDVSGIMERFGMTKTFALVLFAVFANFVYFLYDLATLALYPRLQLLYNRIRR